ncbi:hypothetical protein JG687_00000796 [Phytophthora cactorum]|uniref:RING-type E3 ubiquitin transferase n=1 Tax=Phytophthora cactorum TaxID=29920 RepID=A0A8T1UZY2_9STRA|nr:hypothetical protein JG687_00000796 [Phytophthora cactorum]
MKVNCLESATAALEQSPPQNPYTFTREDYDNLVASTPNCQITRAPVTDPNATKTLSVRQLNDAFKCPICQGIIKETMVVMDCLHRFCGECISIAIRQSKRELLAAARHKLRRAHPHDLAEFERNEDQITEQLNQARHFNNASLANTQSPPVEKKRSSPDGSPSDTAPSSAAASDDESARKKPKVAASKSAETVAAHTVTTSPKLKIRHVKKHLAALLKLDKYDNMCIVLPTVNCTLSGLSKSAKARKSSIRQDLQCDQELEDFVTLKDIYEQYGMGTAWELRLLYHFSQGTIVNGIATHCCNVQHRANS